MSRDSLMTAAVTVPGMSLLALVTACGDGGTRTFESVDDLKSAVESAEHECSDMKRRPSPEGNDEAIEEVWCAEGHSLTVWDEDFEPDARSAAADPMVRNLEDQGLIEHLRGENWHVMSVDGDALDEIQQRFGGERNEHSFPDLDG